jgi:hypothetical protein
MSLTQQIKYKFSAIMVDFIADGDFPLDSPGFPFSFFLQKIGKITLFKRLDQQIRLLWTYFFSVHFAFFYVDISQICLHTKK